MRVLAGTDAIKWTVAAVGIFALLALASCDAAVPARALSLPSPAAIERVVVATPTPGGVDYNATRSVLEIAAAADRAAGDAAYRLAGEAELDAQHAMATIQAAQATATAKYAEGAAATRDARDAELHAVAVEEQRAAAAIAIAAEADRATRQAVVSLTAVAEQDAVHVHQLELVDKERRAETRAADLGEFWNSYVWPIAKGLFVLALITAAIILVFQLTMAGKLMDRLIDFSSTISGHWEPALNGTAYPVENDLLQLGGKTLAKEDGDLLQVLIYAVKADCFQFDALVQGGYPADKKKWVRLMARLERDGWVIKVNVGGSVDKWIVRRDNQGLDIPIHEILTSYRTAFQTMGPAPAPILTSATP